MSISDSLIPYRMLQSITVMLDVCLLVWLLCYSHMAIFPHVNAMLVFVVVCQTEVNVSTGHLLQHSVGIVRITERNGRAMRDTVSNSNPESNNSHTTRLLYF